jgi:hypothetical protein
MSVCAESQNLLHVDSYEVYEPRGGLGLAWMGKLNERVLGGKVKTAFARGGPNNGEPRGVCAEIKNRRSKGKRLNRGYEWAAEAN